MEEITFIGVATHSGLVWFFYEKLLDLNEFELIQFSMLCDFVVNFVQELDYC